MESAASCRACRWGLGCLGMGTSEAPAFLANSQRWSRTISRESDVGVPPSVHLHDLSLNVAFHHANEHTYPVVRTRIARQYVDFIPSLFRQGPELQLLWSMRDEFSPCP